jgi:hypothetical protein
MRTAGGDAVAFQPNSPNVFLAHLVVEHVDWRENWKSLFDRKPLFLAECTMGYRRAVVEAQDRTRWFGERWSKPSFFVLAC